MKVKSQTEIQDRAAFTKVRYANCWEDADILVEALQPAGKICASIGSAGDNSFALLAAGAAHVHIIEMNPAQLACIHLRKASYLNLTHTEFLQLHGEKEATPAQRLQLFEKCIKSLPSQIADYWQQQIETLNKGFGLEGKFESYFTLFRNKVLPWIHNRDRIQTLLKIEKKEERISFYNKKWNNMRWRLLFKIFFSRYMMGKLGRDPAFFKYVEGSVADRILTRAKYALTELSPSRNPYLTWILDGSYGDSLPYALREEHFNSIKNRLEKVTIHAEPLEAFLESNHEKIDAFNLSDIFEYMSEENTKTLSKTIAEHSSPKARLAYWNMLAPRASHQSLPDQFSHLKELSEQLFNKDKAFFYSAFIVDEKRN